MALGKAAYDVTDGPVLTLLNKRIRYLRKKLKRITKLEDSIAQGKSIIKNKEQEEFLKSKPSIIAAVDELEKLHQPISVKVYEEINKALTLDKEKRKRMKQSDEIVEDLLSLIYFGNLFTVKPASDLESIKDRIVHERNWSLWYDFHTYDEKPSVILMYEDLDAYGREKFAKLMSLDYIQNDPYADVAVAIAEKAMDPDDEGPEYGVIASDEKLAEYQSYTIQPDEDQSPVSEEKIEEDEDEDEDYRVEIDGEVVWRPYQCHMGPRFGGRRGGKIDHRFLPSDPSFPKITAIRQILMSGFTRDTDD